MLGCPDRTRSPKGTSHAASGARGHKCTMTSGSLSSGQAQGQLPAPRGTQGLERLPRVCADLHWQQGAGGGGR